MGRKRNLANHDAILKASYRLFMTHGYDKVSLLDIEKECNVHTKSFYRYFKNKDEVLGTIIESIEKKMLEYLRPAFTGDPLFIFALFSMMKREYAIADPGYFRMRGSFIACTDTFIKGFMELYGLSYPQDSNWKSNRDTMLEGLYVLGGMLVVQYGFIKNISDNTISGESADFITNYNVNKLTEETANNYRSFMDYAIRTSLNVLGLRGEEVDNMLELAEFKLGGIDIYGFREFYEKELGFC